MPIDDNCHKYKVNSNSKARIESKITSKMLEIAPTVYYPYQKRLEHVTICRGSMFFLSYVNTLLSTPGWSSNPTPHALQSG